MSDHAEANARAWLENIRKLVDRLNGDDEEDAEAASNEICEAPLSVRVRSEWYSPGEEPTPGEYEILLSTGGPALRIRGGLSGYGEPENAYLEWQDWGEPWTELVPGDADGEDALEAFARCFYFGGS